jgi:hypothetical protein
MCLYRSQDKEFDILHLPTARKSRDADSSKRSQLHAHWPELWVEVQKPVTKRKLLDAKDRCITRSAKKAEWVYVRRYALQPKERLVVNAGAPTTASGSTGAKSLGTLHHLTGLVKRPATTFRFTRGTLKRGEVVPGTWKPSNLVDKDLALWAELTIDSTAPSLTIESSAGSGGWTLDLPAAVWLTSLPRKATPHHHHLAATHFKWYWEFVKFAGGIPQELAHPILDADLPACPPKAGHPVAGAPGTIFCPPSDYP